MPVLFIFYLSLPLTASYFHFLIFLIFSIWAYSQTASPSHFSNLSFTHLDLLSIASQTHFHHFIFYFIFLLTWTYSLLPVIFIFIISFFYSPGLTLYCQSNSFVSTYLDLPSSANSHALTSSLMFT